MSDLVQRICDRLDGLAPASLTVEFPKDWTDEQREKFKAEFKAANAAVPAAFLEPAEPLSPEEIEAWQKSWDELLPEGATVHQIRMLPPGLKVYPGFEMMRAALLAVVEYATPGEPHPGDSRDHAEKATDAEVEAVLAHVLGLIAEGLGIEVDRA